MTCNRLAKLILVLGLVALPSSALAGPIQHMTFRNNLLPGHLTIHRITRTIRRKAKRKKHVERLEYRQQAEWIRCNVDEATPGNVMVCQMMVDRPAKVLSVRRGKKKVLPVPPASDFVMPKGSTRLHTAYKTPQNGTVQVPLVDPAQQAVLHTLLDFAHWQKKRIEVGHRWQRDIYGDGIRGTQTWEFVDLVKIKGDVVARVTLFVEGEFEEPVGRNYVFGKGQAVLYWSRPERMLIKMEAQADYQRKRPNAPEEYKLELEVGLLEHDSLGEAEQERVTNQMIDFDRALKESRAGNNRQARELCREFGSKWPGSLWLPAVDELERRSRPKRATARPISLDQLNALLGKAVIAYDAAGSNEEYDLLELTLEALEDVAAEYRVKLKKLAKGDDPGRRGRAVFALAFSSRPQDFNLVQKAARDESSKVRAMALAGLAARASPETSVELLIASLADEKSVVRRRACRAVAACIPPDHYSVVKAVEKIAHLLIHDKNDGVRREAAVALAAIGAPTDIATLEKALTHELNDENREVIHKAIEKLRRGGG